MRIKGGKNRRLLNYYITNMTSSNFRGFQKRVGTRRRKIKNFGEI